MQLRISYHSSQTAEDITFEIRLDGTVLSHHVLDGEQHCMMHDVQDQDQHTIKTIELELSGKTAHHTSIDHDGNITRDCAVLIDSISLDGIDLTEMFCTGRCCYRHDHNGSGDSILDQFYGYMGQNGIVTWQFELPIYKWFLQNCP
jgi:hypothetical protein